MKTEISIGILKAINYNFQSNQEKQFLSITYL